MSSPAPDRAKATSWNTRSIGLKMAGGSLVALLCFGVAVLRQFRNQARSGWTSALLIGSFLFTALVGALIGFCLALRDHVRERKSKGERVHWVLRAYFDLGIVSLLLWSVMLFAAGIAGIVFYYSFLRPGVGPAR
jgi:hypothetical protein